MTRTAIIAAFPGELKPLVRGWKHQRRNGIDTWAHRDDNLYVAAAFFLAPLMSQAARAQRDTPSAFETACRGQIIYAVACGYNAGWGKVRQAMAEGVDCDGFTSNNYAKDVLGKYALLVDESTVSAQGGS